MPKRTVDSCLTVYTKDVLQHRTGCYTGTITWTWDSRNQSSIGYAVDWPNESVRLRYGDPDGSNPVDLRIALVSTFVRNGGKRWWFSCPLLCEGLPCRRRCSSLNLPRGADYFGCRSCHNLTYRSSQNAHGWSRVLQRL